MIEPALASARSQQTSTATCRGGTVSYAVGQGACSWHGGVREVSRTVEGRERVMQQLNRRVHEHPRYQRLPQCVQMFLAGYIHRCFEERFGPEEQG